MDRLDMFCEAIVGALLDVKNPHTKEALQEHLDFIYALFPEQKVNYEGQLEDIDFIDSNRGIDEAKNQDCQ